MYPLAWLFHPTVTCNRTTFPLLVRSLQSFPAHEKNYAKNHACTTNGIPVKQWLCHLLLHEGLGRHVTGIQGPDWNKFYTMGKLLFIHESAWVGGWNVSANNSETVGHKYLRLGQIVYILVFYNISFSWLLPLDGFQFILRDNENDLLIPWFLMISVTLNSVNQQCFRNNWNSYSLYSNA